MSDSCDNCCTIDTLGAQQQSTLVKVLAINVIMFVVIVGAAIYGKSAALLSDSLDNLGDSVTYGLSLYAIYHGAGTKAKVALFKGSLIFIAACVVIAQIVYRVIYPVLPSYEVMSVSSVAALLANGLCLYLLWRHRNEDINMSSVFECSRNDIATNVSVIVAAFAVWFFDAGWPDLVVATGLAMVLLYSSARVIKGAWMELSKAFPASSV